MDFNKKTLSLKLPNFPEPTTLPRMPSYESMMSPKLEDEDGLKPAMPSSRDKPLFIKLERYEKVINSVNALKEKINEAKQVLNDIRALKDEEDTKLQAWHDDLEQIKENLLNVENMLEESLK